MKIDFNVEIEEGNIDKVYRELEERQKKIYRAWGVEWKRKVTRLVPVDTGKLRQSMSYKVQNDGVAVGTNVNYATYVNNGARGRGGVHFMEKSIEPNKERFQEIAKKILNE